MSNEKYSVRYEYQHKNNYCEHREIHKYRGGSGFKNKEKALKRFKDIQEHPNEYMADSDNSKMLSVRFITIITAEIIY